jgi:HEAT repeat protein
MIRPICVFGLICLLMLIVSCAKPVAERQAFRFPWQEKPEKIPGVKTPQERIAELKAVKSSATTSSAQTAEQLAKEIQREQDPLVRLHIIRAIAELPDPKASAVLHAGLEDPDEAVQIACCEAWGDRGGAEAVQELTTVLEAESNIDVRLAAAKALGDTKSAAAVKPLADVLADNDPAMQRRAIESLKSVSGKDYGYDVQAWQQYASGKPVEKKPISFAERLRQWF